jgi:hypothetical protein
MITKLKTAQNDYYDSIKDLSTEELSAQMELIIRDAQRSVWHLNWLNEQIEIANTEVETISMKYEITTKLLISRKQRI